MQQSIRIDQMWKMLEFKCMFVMQMMTIKISKVLCLVHAF